MKSIDLLMGIQSGTTIVCVLHFIEFIPILNLNRLVAHFELLVVSQISTLFLMI